MGKCNDLSHFASCLGKPQESTRLQLSTLTGAGTDECASLATTFLPFHPRIEKVRTRLSGSISHIFCSLRWREGEGRRRGRKKIHQTGSTPGWCMTMGGGTSGTLHANPSTNCLLAGADIKLKIALTLFLLSHLSESSWISSCSYAEHPAGSAPGLGWEHYQTSWQPHQLLSLPGQREAAPRLQLLPALKTYTAPKMNPLQLGEGCHSQNKIKQNQQSSSCMVHWINTIFAGMCCKINHYQTTSH